MQLTYGVTYANHPEWRMAYANATDLWSDIR